MAIQRTIMKEKTANLLWDSIEDSLKTLGLSAKDFIEASFGVTIPANFKRLVNTDYSGYFKNLLRKQPEPEPSELAQTLAGLKTLKSSPHKIRSLLRQRIKELPHAPGGPPRKVGLDEEKTVCMEIRALRDRYDTREAIRQVARKRNASERTIYRIWGKYYPKKKKKDETSR